MIKTHRLAAALGLMLGTFALGAVQAEEQGLRPLPEDLAAQADEKTEETMPFPEGSLQGAPEATPSTVQDAGIDADDLTGNEDFSSAAAGAKTPGPLARFDKGDKNRNGVLSPVEVRAMKDDSLVFADIDGDADGSISRVEWSAHLQAQLASGDDAE